MVLLSVRKRPAISAIILIMSQNMNVKAELCKEFRGSRTTRGLGTFPAAKLFLCKLGTEHLARNITMTTLLLPRGQEQTFRQPLPITLPRWEEQSPPVKLIKPYFYYFFQATLESLYVIPLLFHNYWAIFFHFFFFFLIA